MRACPTCGRQFNDDLKFCLEDGSSLVDVADEVETRFARVPPPSSGKSRTLTMVAAFVMLLGAGLVIAAIGIGGYIYYSYRSEPWTTTVPTPTPQKPTPYPSSTPPASTIPIVGPPPRQTPTPTSKNDPVIDISKDEQARNHPVPKQISGGVLNGKATSLPKPPYPPAARAVRASGAVSVQVLVDESGSVISASAVSGHPLLRAAAVSAARAARFQPTVLSGQPVKVSGVITYNFVPPE